MAQIEYNQIVAPQCPVGGYINGVVVDRAERLAQEQTMAKKTPPTPYEWTLINHIGTTSEMMLAFFRAKLKSWAERRGIHARPDIEIVYGQKDHDDVWWAWQVILDLPRVRKTARSKRQDWLTSAGGRLEVLRAFDELCTQYLMHAR